jgi:hypothetical protein
MKKNLTGAMLLIFALIRVSAATWEGSAITGGAGDFPAEGLYAACNSFPRDSIVELSNLETGKTATVTIISNVDNPGVFIALSPKTAEALGMQQGTAARVRAVSLAASQAEATLPAARAGVSADPDFNPRVFFEREKAALQATAAAEAPALSQAPTPIAPAVSALQPAAAAPTAAAPAAAAPTAPTAAPPAVAAAQPPAPATPAQAQQKAEVLARAEAEPVQVPAASPTLKEPQPASVAVPATVPTPAPAVAQAPVTATPAAPAAPQAEQKAEILALAEAEPIAGSAVAQGLKEPQPIVAATPQIAAVDTLARPSGKKDGSAKAALAEPAAPEAKSPDKPEAVLSRMAAPVVPPNVPLLTDAEPFERVPAVAAEPAVEALALAAPASAKKAGPSEFGEMAEAELPGSPEEVFVQKPGSSGNVSAVELAEADLPAEAEAIYTDRPAVAAATAREGLSMSEPIAPKEPKQTSVVAIGGTRPSPGAPAVAEMADPAIPTPSESLAAVKPGLTRAELTVADEPGVLTPIQAGSAPAALAAERPAAPAPSMAVATLAEPSLANEPPTGAFAAERPAAPAPSTAVAALAEPSLANEPPTGAFAAAKPALASPPEVALASPTPPSPIESLSATKPALAAPAGETVVALEPALPRPPAAAVASAAPAPTAPEPPATAPTAVATIKGSGGIAEPPASLPVIRGLAKGSYYIQIGVYGTNDALLAASTGLRPAYPVAIERISTKSGAAAYRLYIGPIARDESGLALLKIRSMGYKDAFVREGS